MTRNGAVCDGRKRVPVAAERESCADRYCCTDGGEAGGADARCKARCGNGTMYYGLDQQGIPGTDTESTYACYCGNDLTMEPVADTYCSSGVTGEDNRRRRSSPQGSTWKSMRSMEVYAQAPNEHMEAVVAMCNRQDAKDIDCVVDSVKDWFGTEICMGDSCGLVENEAAAILMGIVMWIVDQLLGCAFGWWAQPSTWITMLGPQADLLDPGSRNVVKRGVGVVQFGKDSLAYDEANKDLVKIFEQPEVGKTAKGQGAAAKRIESMHKLATTVEDKATDWAKTKNLAGKVQTGGVNGMKKGIKNWLPCMPMALVAWVDGGSSFFACMGTCLKEAVTEAFALLVARLVKNCLFTYLKQAIEKVACFPADATVELEGHRTKQMDHLRVGDRVLTADGTYADVYVLSHQNPELSSQFIRLTLEDGRFLEASPNHFVKVSGNCDGVSVDARAKDVEVGACMFGMGVGKATTQLRVTETTPVWKKGIYNPFTLPGNLVVNGVVASSHSDWFLDDYADALGFTHLLPSIYQAVLMPARGLYWLAGPSNARDVLEEYKDQMAQATNQNLVMKPYLDLIWEAVKLPFK